VHRRATISLEQAVLAKNDALAELNRAWLAEHSLLALNLMSSPGSGKTTLLVRTIGDIGRHVTIGVLSGDQATQNDAERIAATGCAVLQINTGTGCHLDAAMIGDALASLAPQLHERSTKGKEGESGGNRGDWRPAGAVLMIENVGNLVCPALFDLGEHTRVVMLSVTEGEDKPLKYPHMFRAAQLMLLTKIDLLPYLQFDVERCVACARRVNPSIGIIHVSAQTGEGMNDWYAWLHAQREG
jgi:hydrogenase nickel incorporation protein HypB